ncbi:hypothetical protein PTTG_29312 [Puccinia triticina 1-1 BBBD Race 1]|uniref:Uncharacterized protein n=1 Tax=Puccinia triticina (isolate 1-1 / race 1 (BBBD)) TaxID=630390 RepID=A0A180G4V1_PUCT1|nr:hypothetical protein PTTG_29312 [Puccinia triticina 1-1 BBBD Race 1]
MPLASGGRPSTVDAPPSTQLANLALTPGGPSQGEPMVEAPHPSSQAVGSLNSQGIKKKSTQRKRRTWMELAAALMDPNDPYKGPRKRESSRSQSSQRSEASHVTASTTSNTAGTQSFGKVDYELICTYLEDEENFQQLFNTGSQTAVGPGQISRARAYERLAKYMNAKDFEQRTGAGIEETEGHHSLVQKLEVICLCFERMDALFKDKANITAMAVFDSIGDLGINAALDHSDVEEGLRDEALIDGTQNLESGSQVELTPRAIQSHTDALSGALERLEEEVSSPSHLEDGRGSSKINPAVIQSSQTSASSKASPTFPTTTHGSALNIYPTVSQSNRSDCYNCKSDLSNCRDDSPQKHYSQLSQKTGGLTAAFESTSLQKLQVMQHQLTLDQQRFDLEVQDRADARQERVLDRQDRQAERLKRQNNQLQRIQMVSKWLCKGRSTAEIQVLSQAFFGV